MLRHIAAMMRLYNLLFGTLTGRRTVMLPNEWSGADYRTTAVHTQASSVKGGLSSPGVDKNVLANAHSVAGWHHTNTTANALLLLLDVLPNHFAGEWPATTRTEVTVVVSNIAL